MNALKFFEAMAQDVERGYVSLEYFIERIGTAYHFESRPDVRHDLERCARRTVMTARGTSLS